jgi:hypothetical protein
MRGYDGDNEGFGVITITVDYKDISIETEIGDRSISMDLDDKETLDLLKEVCKGLGLNAREAKEFIKVLDKIFSLCEWMYSD